MYEALIIYYSLSFLLLLVYLILYRHNWLPLLLLLVFCPFIGPILVYIMYQKGREKEGQLPDWLIRQESGTRIQQLLHPDKMKELNSVPLADALILNDSKVKRQMMIDLLKNESTNITFLKMALENQDSETSHYAATAILELKRKLMNSIQSYESILEKEHSSINVLIPYADTIKDYIDYGFFDEVTELEYRKIYAGILEQILEIQPRNAEFYCKKINIELELAQYEKAKYFSEQFLAFCPSEEEAYFIMMKIYYHLKEEEQFKDALTRLRKSSIRFSPEGLSKVRFWLRGEKYETEI